MARDRGGIRFDSFDLSVDDFRAAGGEFDRTDHMVSPRLGIILKPNEQLSIYGSFSRSYLPQSGDQFSGLDINSETLKPERFDNYEIGAWEPVEGPLATVAIYRLDRTNTGRQPRWQRHLPADGRAAQGAGTRIERQCHQPLASLGGMPWQKAEVTRPRPPAQAAIARCHWSRVIRRHCGTAMTSSVARARAWRDRSIKVVHDHQQPVKLPAIPGLTARLFYRITEAVEAQINVENIFGADYFPTANADNNIAPGAPTTLRGTNRVGF